MLSEARPRLFIFENVHALTFDNKAQAARSSTGCYLRSKPPATAAAGRRGQLGKVLNAADYGVPQARRRLFVVGSRKRERLPRLPSPTHFGQWERRSRSRGVVPHVTSGEVLNGLVTEPEPEEVVRGSWGHLLPQIPPGDNYLHFTARRGHPEPIFD